MRHIMFTNQDGQSVYVECEYILNSWVVHYIEDADTGEELDWDLSDEDYTLMEEALSYGERRDYD